MTRRRTAAWLLWLCMIACVSACRHDGDATEVLKNTCLTDLDCPGRDISCDQRVLQCVRRRPVEPYQVLLQVQAESTGTSLIDGGVELVTQATFELTLDAAIENEVLEVPSAVRARGKVQARLDGEMQLLESQVTLTPRAKDGALRSIVVNTTKYSADAGTHIDVPLNPKLLYDVRVQPLLLASSQLPPLRTDSPYDPKTPLDIEYEKVDPYSARLVSSDLASWAGHRVRLEDKMSGEVVSSIDEVKGAPDVAADAGVRQGDAGSFTLYAKPEVLDEPKKFDFVVGLKDFPRWQVKVAMEGTSFVNSPLVSMPNVPKIVNFSGKVEAEESDQPLAYANMQFISDFPVPEAPDYVGDIDWCRLRLGEPALRCSARLSTTTDAEGDFNIKLLPGTYRVVITPDAKSLYSRDRATHIETLSVQAEADGLVRPQLISVKGATRYDGTVRSWLGHGMPNVTVQARALGVEIANEGELSRYNRTVSAITNSRGQFQLFVDVGLYDLSIETPANSGFAWLVCPNYAIKSRGQPVISLRPLEPPTPVPLAGTVEHNGVMLPGARIEAFAVLKTKDGLTRLLPIARGVSDEKGAFYLAMPPRVPRLDLDDRPSCPPPLELPDAGSAEPSLVGQDDAATLDSGSKAP